MEPIGDKKLPPIFLSGPENVLAVCLCGRRKSYPAVASRKTFSCDCGSSPLRFARPGHHPGGTYRGALFCAACPGVLRAPIGCDPSLTADPSAAFRARFNPGIPRTTTRWRRRQVTPARKTFWRRSLLSGLEPSARVFSKTRRGWGRHAGLDPRAGEITLTASSAMVYADARFRVAKQTVGTERPGEVCLGND